VYSTCLFCHNSLGANAVIAECPVGRRLAFDSQKGRLWVVCPHCTRWNLTPFEDRWEAVEWCERRFRELRLRVQTPNIGFARAPEGLDLIRIGVPLRPELAAWRYGDQFRVRFRRNAVRLASAGVALGAAYTGAATGAFNSLLGSGAALAPALWPVSIWIMQGIAVYRDSFRTTLVPRPSGRPLEIIGADLKETGLLPTGPAGWQLHLRSAGGWTLFEGESARRALGVLLPRVNETGARRRTVEGAVAQLVSAASPDAYLHQVAELSRSRTGDYVERLARFNRDGEVTGSAYTYGGRPAGPKDDGALVNLAVEVRLALEMALHEESERRAMEGEMGALTAAWREAEEIAAIADNLLLPPGTQDFIDRHRPTPSTERSSGRTGNSSP
jgi:hypothetical protein